MKKNIKFFVSAVAVIFIFTLVVFTINTTDELQTPLTQKMLQKSPPQEGFSLKEFKHPRDRKVPSLDIAKCGDYNKEAAKFDELIQQNKPSIDLMEKAFRIGHVAANPDEVFEDAIYTFPRNDFYLYRAFLCQKIKAGQTPEALFLLEQSNKFLASIAESQQTYINKLLSIYFLKRNADFAKSFKDENIVKTLPPSLIASLRLTQTPEQMWTEAGLKEFQLASAVILGPLDKNYFEMTVFSSGESSFKERVAEKITGWLAPKLIRRNDTLNMLAESYAVQATGACTSLNEQQCTDIYNNITATTGLNFFINPVGRAITKMLVPRLMNTIHKFTLGTDSLNKAVEEL